MSNNNPKQIPTILLPTKEGSKDEDQYNKYYFSPACKAVRRLLCDYLNNKRDLSVSRSDDRTRLQCPSYSESQAYESGYRAALKEILNLIDR